MLPYPGYKEEALKSFTLPCFSMIATGNCSYENHCKFLHDPRIKTKYCGNARQLANLAKLLGKQQRGSNSNNSEKGFALFYWPPMKVTSQSCNPNDIYEVPALSFQGNSKTYSYLCLASMWNNFLTNVSQSEDPVVGRCAHDDGSYEVKNNVTGRPRLAILRELSQTSYQTHHIQAINIASPQMRGISVLCDNESVATTAAEWSDDDKSGR